MSFGIDPGYVLNLFKSSFSIDEEVRSYSEKEILNLLENYPFDLLLCCTAILENKELPVQAYQISLIYIAKILTPNKKMTKDKLIMGWNSLDQNENRKENQLKITSMIKKNIIRMFEINDPVIQSNLAQVNALVFMIERSNFSNSFSIILNYLTDDRFPLFVRISAIKTIFVTFDINDDIEYCFTDAFVSLFEKMMNYFKIVLENFIKNSVEFITNIYLALGAFTKIVINSRLKLFDEDDPWYILCGQKILEYCNDLKLFQAIFIFFYKYFVNFYDVKKDGPPKPLISIVSIASLIFEQENIMKQNINYSSIVSDFWNEIIKFENNIGFNNYQYEQFEKNKKLYSSLPNINKIKPKNNQMKYYGIVNYAISEYNLIYKLLNVMVHIYSNDDVEDLEINEPHMFATLCIQKLFIYQPILVLEKINEFIQNNINDDNWEIQHGILLMINCSCIQIPTLEKKTIPPFLNNTDFFIKVFQSNVPRINEVTYITLSSIFLRFKNIFSDDLLVYYFNSFWNLTNEVIILSGIQSLISFINIFNNDKDGLIKYIEIIIKISNYLLTFDNSEINCQAFYIKQCLLENVKNEDIVKTIAIPYLSNPINCVGKIRLISTIFKYHGNIFQNYSNEIINELFKLISLHNATICEDAILALIQIISSLGNSFSFYNEQLLNLIQDSFSSQNQNIIVSVCSLLAILFKNCPDFLQYLECTIQTILIQFNSDLFQRENMEYLPLIVHPFCKIILSISSYQLESNIIKSLFDIIYKLSKIKINKNCKKDIDFANKLYQCLFIGYSGIALLSRNDIKLLNSLKTKLFDLVISFNDLPRTSTKTLYEFCNFMEVMLDVAGKNPRFQIILSNQRNLLLLLWSLVQQDNILKEKAKYILGIMSK